MSNKCVNEAALAALA